MNFQGDAAVTAERKRTRKNQKYKIKFNSGFSLRNWRELDTLQSFPRSKKGYIPKELKWNHIHLCPQ